MKKILLVLGVLLANSALASGVPASFTYQGIVMNSAGTAPLTSVVSLKLSIYDPTGTCLLYQEQQANIDLSQTNGTFAIQVGSATGAAKRTSSDQGLAMTAVFANNGQILAISTTGCTAGYTPSANDGRLLRVAVTNGGSTVTISPDLQINAVPNAVVAETVQGLTPANLIKNQAGSISNNATGSFRVESETVTAGSNSSCTFSGGTSFIASSTPNTTGLCSVTFATPFSAIPVCTVTINSTDSTATSLYAARIYALSAGSLSFMVQATGNTTTSLPGGNGSPAEIICMGPR